MVEKIDWKNIVKEIPEEEQLRLLEKERRTRNIAVYGKDGFIETWRKRFEYKGIPFELAILRYYTFDEGFTPLSGRVCDRHVVVEFPEEIRDLVDLQESVGVDEFLWHDTLHSWTENMDLWQQLQVAYEMAIKDIDNLPELLQSKIHELEEKLQKLREWYNRVGP